MSFSAPSVRLLSQLADVNLSSPPADPAALVYDDGEDTFYLAAPGSGSPGGANGTVQYNASGSLAGALNSQVDSFGNVWVGATVNAKAGSGQYVVLGTPVSPINGSYYVTVGFSSGLASVQGYQQGGGIIPLSLAGGSQVYVAMGVTEDGDDGLLNLGTSFGSVWPSHIRMLLAGGVDADVRLAVFSGGLIVKNYYNYIPAPIGILTLRRADDTSTLAAFSDGSLSLPLAGWIVNANGSTSFAGGSMTTGTDGSISLHNHNLNLDATAHLSANGTGAVTATGVWTYTGNISAANLSGTNTGDQNLSVCLQAANNLSDLTSASTARTNLGLGTAATDAASAFDAAGAAASAQSAAETYASNASNLASGMVATARLGSGSATSSTYLRGDSTWATVTGGVASVGLTMPAQFSVASSPVTSSGTIAVTWATESANLVFAGPSSGGAVAPTFRSLVSTDIPALAYVSSVGLTMPGIFSVASSPVTSSGTIAVTLATETANAVFAGPTTGGATTPTFRALVSSDIPSLSYVTSVGLSAPAIFTVSGSPVTSTGSLTFTLANESANLVFAGPTTGSAAAPTFRSLVAADIPSLGYVSSTSTQTAHYALIGPSSGSPAAPTFRALVSSDIPSLAYVTSVGLSLPAMFTVSGSPVTSSGSLTAVLANESANLVFVGPSSGGAAAPTFRALVAADVAGAVAVVNAYDGTAYTALVANNSLTTQTRGIWAIDLQPFNVSSSPGSFPSAPGGLATGAYSILIGANNTDGGGQQAVGIGYSNLVGANGFCLSAGNTAGGNCTTIGVSNTASNDAVVIGNNNNVAYSSCFGDFWIITGFNCFGIGVGGSYTMTNGSEQAFSDGLSQAGQVLGAGTTSSIGGTAAFNVDVPNAGNGYVWAGEIEIVSTDTAGNSSHMLTSYSCSNISGTVTPVGPTAYTTTQDTIGTPIVLSLTMTANGSSGFTLTLTCGSAVPVNHYVRTTYMHCAVPSGGGS